MTATITDFQVKRPSIDPRDSKELIRAQEESRMMRARERAMKSALIAYPASFAQGWYAIPSQTTLGSVHLGAINWTTGQPLFCSCESYVNWCIHAGAMRIHWEKAREIDDQTYRQMQKAAIEQEERESE